MKKEAAAALAKQPIPETMLEAARQFADPQAAHDFCVQMRWPYGVGCPLSECGSMAVAYMPKRRRWYCNDCKRQFTAKTGTIFEDSPIGFDKWLPAIWLIASNRNGISSYEIARGIKVTQKTAWFMLHRIREAFANEAFSFLRGPVEADETYIGGKREARPLRHVGFRMPVGYRRMEAPGFGKTAVMGIVERKDKDGKGRVRAFVIPSNRKGTLLDKIRRHVHPGATVYTDALKSYQRLGDDNAYVHYVVNHAVEYVNGHIHTNSIEAFWSVFKRTIKGTYVAPRPWHLQRYVEEQVFRFNARRDKDGERFPDALKRADGVRLTWKALMANSPTWRLKPGRAAKSPAYEGR